MASASIAINGGTLTGQNISLAASATANVSIAFATQMDGQLNFGEVAATSEVFITVDGAASITASGDLTIIAISDITTIVSRGTQTDGDGSNDKDQDAAIAASVIASQATVTIGDTAALTAGDDAVIVAQNIVDVTTIADGLQGDADGGAIVATSVVEGNTLVLVEDSAAITATNLLTLAALTDRTVTTTAIATPDGATHDGDASTTTQGQSMTGTPLVRSRSPVRVARMSESPVRWRSIMRQ